MKNSSTHKTDSKYDFFIITGEHSGDTHASLFVNELLKRQRELKIGGILGPKLRALGLSPFMKMESFQIMGFVEIILAFPKIYRQFKKTLNHILETQPKVIVFVDYPGFNIRMAHALRKKGFKGKLIQFICPSVWAWGKKRIPQMEADLDALLCIFPFEAPIFSSSKLEISYVGNPSVELLKNYQYDPNWKQKIGLTDDNPIIGVFPGSRKKEIISNFPRMLKTLERFKQNHSEARFVISIADDDLGDFILKLSKNSTLSLNEDLFFVQRNHTLELMRDSHTACAKSGTVNLELALSKTPTVVVYNVSTINYLIAKYFFRLKLKFYCIVNILKNKEVFPELMHKNFTSRNLSHHLERLYTKGVVRDLSVSNCQELIDELGDIVCSEKTASILLKHL